MLFPDEPCGVCGAAHTACTATHGAPRIDQLGASDGAAPPPSAPPLVAEVIQATLPPNHFTTATYRGRKKLLVP